MSYTRCLTVWVLLFVLLVELGNSQEQSLNWTELPPLPNELGVAGPFVGVHNKHLIVAGGANFPRPVWENEKQWHSAIYAMSKNGQGYGWEEVGELPRATGYGANVSTKDGVVCIGGNDASTLFDACFRLAWNKETGKIEQTDLPSLPHPMAYGSACLIGQTIYLAGGQTGPSLDTAINYFLKLDLSAKDPKWIESAPWPFSPRAFNITVAQNNGFRDCMYVIGGRYEEEGEVQFLDDCWEYDPSKDSWRQRASLPHAVTAGTGIHFGQSHILVLSGDDGKLFDQTDALKDDHPGFPKRTFAYHTITDRWTPMGSSPQNQVTTTAVMFEKSIVLPTGEIRPRVRSPKVWKIEPAVQKGMFGVIDYIVIFLYLASLVLIGVYFSWKTKSTEDYFRASGSIPWWAAGCSIFATMLSSLTFTGVPSKAFAQDWVYAVGNFMIPVVAIFAVFVALPFYRRIDATSAYEYLEQRFHRSIRIFGSLCFSVYHLFRMAIVMSLTGLALAVATPLTPVQSVLLMGVLSIIYCALGGISAVIWTDTLQTVVLMGGAVLAIGWMLAGTGNSLGDSFSEAVTSGKLRMSNWHWSAFDAQIAFWAIVLGAIGQNTSSYTADQAVVQRYMTTKTQSLAARAIWTNALLTIPATILFFGIGTALFLFYRAHPERMDISITTDQIFPLFISRELPIGVAGLIVAAVFAAAQSTVSTSMNSVATTLLTDCLSGPTSNLSDKGRLRLAQILTVLLGVAGTAIALFFVNPEIKSLFDQFLKVIGLFMGVLGGLFVLGVLFHRPNTLGAWTGAIAGNVVLFCVWKYTNVNGYLYALIGIVTCVVVGYLASLLRAPKPGVEDLCVGSAG
ncbi:MAG: kelch repeat-containing protein [Planctomycetota bacterium]